MVEAGQDIQVCLREVFLLLEYRCDDGEDKSPARSFHGINRPKEEINIF